MLLLALLWIVLLAPSAIRSHVDRRENFIGELDRLRIAVESHRSPDDSPLFVDSLPPPPPVLTAAQRRRRTS
ncbi:MAG: hypothetical protein ABIW46_09285, partial [Acidimicrobiales bacterium]